MKTTVIIQARMGSSRLPGKVLMNLVDKPILAHVINRCKAIPLVDDIVVATTTDPADEVIADLVRSESVAVHRGSESHVLSRYYEAAIANQSDVVVRVTSDCPLLDPQVSNDVIRMFKEASSAQYCSNTLTRTFPQGLDTEVFSFDALEQAYRNADQAYEQEHVTPYIYQHDDQFRLLQYTHLKDYSHYRWTVDTAEDYQLVDQIYRELYRPGDIFSWQETIKLCESHPELVNMNAHIVQKKLGE
ncbi:glycosyltransferase family protein [Paenibacillus sp. YYML68]|uniref:glycosyltransferase family protein n=1 Tax=Paenibacillus sp. YYML68 TaxID=2909250 RepID=UPI00248F6F02|nr:glycosyltransferase family protein [Paenibacillus sp. YYML68]